MTDRTAPTLDGPDPLISGVLDDVRRQRQARSVPAAALALVLDPLAGLPVMSAMAMHGYYGWKVDVQLGSADARRAAATRLGLSESPDLYGDISCPLAEQVGTYADIETKVYSRADAADTEAAS